MHKIFVIFCLLVLSLGPITASAQELNATVEINTQKIQGTNKSVFENLKKVMLEFINDRQWTQQHYKASERIKCAFTLIINKYDDATGHFECDGYVQSLRPVYGASYTSTTWNVHDKKFNFDFKEFDQLNFNIDQLDNNLTALLAYYCYLIIGIDMDTMSPMGGTEVLQQAMTVANNAQSLQAPGWKALEDVTNRFGIINDYVSEAMKPFRQLQYDYHRKGLDQMADDPATAREAVSAAIKQLNLAYLNKPLSYLPRLFAEYKRDELVGIYKGQGTSKDKQPVYDILVKINPSQLKYWKDLLN